MGHVFILFHQILRTKSYRSTVLLPVISWTPKTHKLFKELMSGFVVIFSERTDVAAMPEAKWNIYKNLPLLKKGQLIS